MPLVSVSSVIESSSNPSGGYLDRTVEERKDNRAQRIIVSWGGEDYTEDEEDESEEK